MTGNAWLRQEPAENATRLGTVLLRGEPVVILAVYGEWAQVLWAPQPGIEVIGWVPLRWLGTASPVPADIITPTASP
jgi:hypothetical protein